MHPRPRRATAWLFALLIPLLGVSLAAPALAAPQSTSAAAAASPTCQKPAPRNDDSIHIQGCLTDNREKPPTPVPGVKISVKDESGKVVGTGTSDATGIFDIPLPGAAIDNLGKTFEVNIDTGSLPEGAALANPKQVSLKVELKLDSDVYVTFPIGDAAGGGTNKLTQAAQLAVGGLVFSLLLAMAALGLSMIFGTTGLTNFAHGELITFGALVAFGIDRLPGDITIGGVNVTMVTAILVALVASIFFGWAQDKAIWKPLRKRGTGLIAAMIVSIGLSIFLRNVYQYFAGAANHNYSQWTSPQPWHIGAILITPKDVGVIIFSSIVLVLVALAVQKTKIGKATRAVSDNPALAASSGINVDRVISVVWAAGAGLAGLSGVLLGMTQGFDYQIGFKILLLVFAAVVLGGLGSLWGALIGSFIIGIFIEVSTLFIPAELKFVGALVVLILVLLVRPQGLLGRAERVG
jgi:branched-subunit amino acid ABC-type transport system permease component